MRKPKMKRRGGVDLVIAIGGSPGMGKKKPHKHGEEEECPCGMPGCPGCEEAEGQEEESGGAYGPGDKSVEYHEERMDLMEERLARIEAMIAGDEEVDEEDYESNHNSNSDDSY